MNEVLKALNRLVSEGVIQTYAIGGAVGAAFYIQAAQTKTEFNRRAKASMEEYLRSKSWVEKVQSIERMNAADKVMKEAMRRALERPTDR